MTERRESRALYMFLYRKHVTTPILHRIFCLWWDKSGRHLAEKNS